MKVNQLEKRANKANLNYRKAKELKMGTKKELPVFLQNHTLINKRWDNV